MREQIRINIQICKVQHDAIRRMLLDFPIDAKDIVEEKVSHLLYSLAQLLIKHLTLEDDWLYPLLMKSKNESVREKAKKYSEEMGHLSADFNSFYERWGKNGAISKNPADFLDDCSIVFSLLRVRVAKEEYDLFPEALLL